MRRRHPARPIGPLGAFDTTVTKASAWGAVTEKRRKEVVSLMADATSSDSARDRRWLILGVIGIAQLMVVLDSSA